MYRILIIDDEQVVREGMSTNIHWPDLGFELVGACRDGREGLEQVSRLRPDVVITDICMPFVDGLELAGAIADELPSTKTILLTGYDEFEYAQEAVKLKVHDFLLKPITAAELTEMLRDLRTRLDAERDQRQKLDRLQEQLRATLPVYRERFLNRLVGSGVPGEDAGRTLELLELKMPGPRYVTMICDLDPYLPEETPASNGSSDEHLSGIALQNIVSAVAGDAHGIVSFSTPAEEAVAIISLDGSANELADSTAWAVEKAEQISERAQREVGRTISVGIGGVASGLRELSRSYDEARTALDHRFVLGGNQIITIEQVRGGTERPAAPTESDPSRRYTRAIKAGVSGRAVPALTSVVDSLRQSAADMDHCHVVMHQLLAETLSSFEAIGVEYRDVPSLGNNPFSRLAAFKTLDEMERWFADAAEEFGIDMVFEGPTSEAAIQEQVQMLQNALAEGPDAIALAALDTQSVLDQIRTAMRQDIPIVGFDSGVPNAPEGAIVANASTDNRAAAAIAAEEMFEAIAEDVSSVSTSNPVTIAVLSQDATSQSVTFRGFGFRDRMVELLVENGVSRNAIRVQGNPAYVDDDNPQSNNPAVIIDMIVPASPRDQDVVASTNAVFQRIDDNNIRGIFASNEGTARGVLSATNDGNELATTYDEVIVIGFDAGEAQKNAVRREYFYGSITQDPYQIGYKAVELAYRAAQGESVSDVDTGAKFYNSENMDDPDIAQLLYD